MNRVSIEDCLNNVNSRFELIKLVSIRAKQLARGHKRLVESGKEKDILTSMREISEDKIYPVYEDLNEEK